MWYKLLFSCWKFWKKSEYKKIDKKYLSIFYQSLLVMKFNKKKWCYRDVSEIENIWNNLKKIAYVYKKYPYLWEESKIYKKYIEFKRCKDEDQVIIYMLWFFIFISYISNELISVLGVPRYKKWFDWSIGNITREGIGTLITTFHPQTEVVNYPLNRPRCVPYFQVRRMFWGLDGSLRVISFPNFRKRFKAYWGHQER